MIKNAFGLEDKYLALPHTAKHRWINKDLMQQGQQATAYVLPGVRGKPNGTSGKKYSNTQVTESEGRQAWDSTQPIGDFGKNPL